MQLKRAFIGALSLAALSALGAAPAAAATKASSSSAQKAASVGNAHAYLRLNLGRSKAWLGQTIPVTISAQFRAVDGVTLEGLPELKSDAVFTSDIARDPKQATQIINGEPVLVAAWTGTITPSSAGPLALSVELPVRIRFHDAALEPAPREQEQEEDPFQSMMNIDPADPSSIQRIFRSMQRSLPMAFDEPLVGRAHDEAVTLKASVPPLDVQALPIAGQPGSFSGAVGRFELRASVSSTTARAHEPLTLTVMVKGDGDLDRVSLTGVASSADWKAYPMSAKSEPPAPGKRAASRTFEQVLIPSHGGALTIPTIELPVFDPVSGRYTTASTAPITLDVDGPAVADAPPLVPSVTPSPGRPRENAAPSTLPPPAPSALIDGPRTIALELAPILAILLGAVFLRLRSKRDPEKALRRALRQNAQHGRAADFYEAARRLIVVHFAQRWGVTETEVTADALRAKLGTDAEPLLAAISTSDALRFGRRELEPMQLGALCSSIEESLRKAA